jgi:hypothetical protein
MEAAEPIWQWAKLPTFLVRRETPSTLRGHMFRAAVRVSGGAEQAERGRHRAFDAGADQFRINVHVDFHIGADIVGGTPMLRSLRGMSALSGSSESTSIRRT